MLLDASPLPLTNSWWHSYTEKKKKNNENYNYNDTTNINNNIYTCQQRLGVRAAALSRQTGLL